MSRTRILIVGYGRMGRLVESLAPEAGLDVAGRVDIDNADRPGDWPEADVAIDFSTAAAVAGNARHLARRGTNLVIGTTGCPSGEVNRLLQRGQYEAAKQAAADYRDIFGRENFYCELMDHNIEIERRHRDDLIRLAKELGLPFLARLADSEVFLEAAETGVGIFEMDPLASGAEREQFMPIVEWADPEYKQRTNKVIELSHPAWVSGRAL